MEKDLTQFMGGDPLKSLRYLKLKYGVAEMNDSAETLDATTYFITDASLAAAPYVKELVQIFEGVRKDKNLKSSLVVLFDSENKKAGILSGAISKHISCVVPQDEKEKALLLYGAVGFVSLRYKAADDSYFLQIMKLGVPLILPKVSDQEGNLGHAAYFVEKIDPETVGQAIVKLENSPTLRDSIVKSALEQIKMLQERS